jgi:hypothetical protein
VIDEDALRRAIRAAARRMEGAPTSQAHFAHARRVYLAALIEEFAGELSRIVRYWDVDTEEELLAQVRAHGLEEVLTRTAVK